MTVFSARTGNTNAILICTALAMANVFTGYDTASVAAVISDRRFMDQWGFSPAMLGAFSVLINVGNCLAYLGPMVIFTSAFGRRWTMIAGSFILMAGASMVAGASHEAVLLVGRVLCGFGVSICQGTFAAWAAEIAPTAIRGAAVCLIQCSYQIGVFIAFWVSLGTTRIPGTDAWRTLVALQMIFGIIVVVNAFFSPDSPRTLLQRAEDPMNVTDDKVELARANLCRIRRLSDSDPSLIQEWHTLQQDAVSRKEERQAYKLSSLLRQRAVWKRIAFGAGSPILAQLTGVAALMLYGITVFDSFNLGGNTISLLINGVGGSLQLVACLFPVFFVDRIGRKKIMMLGPAITAVGYLFLAALFEKWPEATNRGAGIWMIICIFAIQCSYAGALGPVAILIATEIWPQPLRDFGISVSLLGQAIAIIIVNQLWPVLSDALSFRLYWLMLGINVISVLVVYIWWPETKNLSLEEMDILFEGIRRDTVTAVPVSDSNESLTEAGAVTRKGKTNASKSVDTQQWPSQAEK